MGSTFSGYSIAVSGMYVSQSSLAVTSNNLANINTTGYSRCRTVNAEKATSQTGGIANGDGVEISEINRIRNQLYDKTYRQQNAKSNYWSVKETNLEEIQTILNEFSTDDGTSDDGLQQTIQNFFASWEELAKDPSSLSCRQSVIEYAESLVDLITTIDEQLQHIQQDSADQVKTGVDTLNELAQQIADLNAQIVKTEVSGVEASDLRDQRDNLLDEMSAYVDITVTEHANGSVMVSLGGVSIVDGTNLHTLAVSGDGSMSNPLQVYWEELGCEADIANGGILAYLEDADQNGVNSISSADIPYNYTAGTSSSISNLRQGLNDLITSIAVKINALHSTGAGLDGSTGLDFFVVADASQPLSSSNIVVNPELDDPNKLAAGTSGEEGDNTIASAISGVMSEEVFYFDGLLMDGSSFYESLVSWVATAGSTAAGYYANYSNLVLQVDTQRMSLSSVSLDEEMANMIMYQKAYSASSRFLNLVDNLIGEMIAALG